MASDGRCSTEADFGGFSLTISVTSDAEVKRLFDGLCEGGKVQMPLGKTFFASSFGMLKDRFGVGWMVINQSR
jgi:PhnB protein